MTQEELNEYNKLSQEGKDLYNWGMRQHPEWTHKQAFTFAVIGGIASGPFNDPNGTEPPGALYERILVKAQEFIKKDFPRIYQQVKDVFRRAIDWLANAVTVTLNKIIDFFR